MNYKSLELELNSKKEILRIKEEEVVIHILGILQPLFPCVTKVKVTYSRGVMIYIKNENGRFDHEVNIYNNVNYNDVGKFVPQLSYSSPRISIGDIYEIDYLEVITYIAKEMKYPVSELFTYFTDAVISLGKLEDDVNAVWHKINRIAYDAEQKKKEEKKEKFFNDLKVGNYYIKRDVGRRFTKYEFIKITKINPKTTSYIYVDRINDECTLNYLDNNIFHPKRVKNDEVYPTLKSFELSSFDDVKECVKCYLAEL